MVIAEFYQNKFEAAAAVANPNSHQKEDEKSLVEIFEQFDSDAADDEKISEGAELSRKC